MNQLKFQVWLWTSGCNLWCLDKSTQMPPISPSTNTTTISSHNVKRSLIYLLAEFHWWHSIHQKSTTSVISFIDGDPVTSLKGNEKQFHPGKENIFITAFRNQKQKGCNYLVAEGYDWKKTVLNCFSLIKKKILECLERLVKCPLHF